MIFERRWYQTEAVDSIFRYFEQKDGNPVVAMPTGTGKSVVIALFLQIIYQYWAHQRVMMLTHVKELIGQNAAKLLDAWPTAPLGIYSAGLRQRATMNPIIFGGVKSVVNCVEAFGWVDLLIIDECHLINPSASSDYQKIIAKLKEINPKLKVIGLTATWYRLGQGLLTQGNIFTDICYNICDTIGFNRLISEGYLSPPIPKTTKTLLDVSKVSIGSNGDFTQSQLQAAVDKQDVNFSAVSEMVERGQDRHSWLTFCSGIEHAEHIAELLNNYFGIPTVAVHSNMSTGERDAAIKGFKNGDYRALTCNNIFTTGQDHPPIDLIGMLRPTTSTGLWVQMVGRGTRPSPETGKRNCMILDYARNCQRLGPIDDPNIPRPKGGGGGDAPVKICDYCGAFNHARAAFCIDCGQPFVFEQKLIRQADTRQILSSGMPQVERYEVSRVMYNRHVARKSGKTNIKVSYMCGLQMFQEYISFDQTGYALHRAHEWWRQRHESPPPLSTDLALLGLSQLRTPKAIKVWVNKNPPEILSHEY